MKKVVKYLGFYDLEIFCEENRVRSLAAVNKMTYVASAIRRSGCAVEIVSPSWTANSNGYFKSRKTCVSDNVKLLLGPTFGANNYVTRKLRVIFSLMWMFVYLISSIKKGETVFVYHSILGSYPIYFARLFCDFKIVLELNEVYQDLGSLSRINRVLENWMIKESSCYILSTELLRSKIDSRKPSLVNYGNYSSFEDYHPSYSGKVKVVYAGVIDTHKLGAFNAVDCAKYLTGEYEIRIIGFGNEADILKLCDLIDKNNGISECKVVYDGIKTGEEYIQYVSNCNIGLSTQTPDAKFNNTSFPSKVLSYLSLGLTVVSIDIQAIKSSKVGHLLHYYSENSGKSIAKTIRKIDVHSADVGRNFLKELDVEFVNDLNVIINNNEQ